MAYTPSARLVSPFPRLRRPVIMRCPPTAAGHLGADQGLHRLGPREAADRQGAAPPGVMPPLQLSALSFLASGCAEPSCRASVHVMHPLPLLTCRMSQRSLLIRHLIHPSVSQTGVLRAAEAQLRGARAHGLLPGATRQRHVLEHRDGGDVGRRRQVRRRRSTAICHGPNRASMQIAPTPAAQCVNGLWTTLCIQRIPLPLLF